jgi:hypothetical protein
MAAFLDGYEGNKERTDRWIKTYPEGRLEATIVNFDPDKGSILVRAAAWRNQTETEPAGIDFAFGYQAAYNANMKRWFVEDTVTSALMRVMALVMGNTEKATKEVMASIKTETPAADYDYWTTKHGDVPSFQSEQDLLEAEQKQNATGSIAEVTSHLGNEMTAHVPECSHGARIWREGVSAKTGKAWGNYSCIERKPNQCEPVWYVFTGRGKWEPQI